MKSPPDGGLFQKKKIKTKMSKNNKKKIRDKMRNLTQKIKKKESSVMIELRTLTNFA
jgi:uncharacterized membrane protein